MTKDSKPWVANFDASENVVLQVEEMQRIGLSPELVREIDAGKDALSSLPDDLVYDAYATPAELDPEKTQMFELPPSKTTLVDPDYVPLPPSAFKLPLPPPPRNHPPEFHLTVGALIEKLSKFDPAARVIVYGYDEYGDGVARNCSHNEWTNTVVIDDDEIVRE